MTTGYFEHEIFAFILRGTWDYNIGNVVAWDIGESGGSLGYLEGLFCLWSLKADTSNISRFYERLMLIKGRRA